MNNVFLFLTLLLALPATAQEWENSIFWEVTRGKKSKPSYIIGTHHLHNADFAKKSEAIQKALKRADLVVGEIILDTNLLKMAMKMMSMMYMKDKKIKDLVSSEDYQAIDKCLQEYAKMGIAMLNNMKPVMLTQMIMMGKYTKSLSEEDQKSFAKVQAADNSIDMYFQKQAIKQKKKIQELETADFQAKILYDIPIDKQIEALLNTVYDRAGNTKDDLVMLNKFYQEQNISKLTEITQKNATEEELKPLLHDRNNAWIPQLDTMFKSGQSVFVAVGAGHLLGTTGILTQLKAKGYTIKPIKIQL